MITSNPLYILSVLCLIIVFCEWLSKKRVFKQVGTALLVILVTAVLANLGLVPASAPATPTYSVIFEYIAPLSIFYLLLDVNLVSLKKAGIPMLSLFILGTIGTIAGVLVASRLAGGEDSLGEFHAVISGMFAGTYTGGSINFNAVALNYNMQEQGNIFAGAVAIDNIITAVWMIITITIPKLLQSVWPRIAKGSQSGEVGQADNTYEESETLTPKDLAVMGALGLAALFCTIQFTKYLAMYGIHIPSILILTTLALILAQIPAVHRLKGGRILGLFMVYLFLAVIGAYCDVSAVMSVGLLAWHLFLFASVLVLVHGIILFGLGGLIKQDWQLLSIASQANIGGSTTALALAKSFGRYDLLLPAVLVGALGNGIGTYLGFFVVYLLGS